MASKIKPAKDDKIFKIKEDGTIITEDNTTQPQKKKSKKWLWFLLIIPVSFLCLLVGYLIERERYDEREEKHKEYVSRLITQKVYELIGADQVYWTTEGVSVTLHLYSDCSEFYNMPVSQGSVAGAIKYFIKQRGVNYNTTQGVWISSSITLHNGDEVLCKTCKNKVNKR
jgi:hypothetical protein